jgi:hypothetical protein
MKKKLLFAISIVFALSFHSLLAATNLVQNGGFESGTSDWPIAFGTFSITAANGPTASGTASALFGGGSTTGNGEVVQKITTVPGTSYVVQFDYKSLDSGTADSEEVDVVISGTDSSTLLNLDRGPTYGGEPTTSFQTAVGTFTAPATSGSITLFGYDKAVIDNVIVTTGSFSAPGKYTGSVKVSSTIPSQSIASFHTESVVARVTPSGGLFLIEQPSGIIETAAFQNENTLAHSGTTVAVTVSGKTNIKFTTISNSFTGGPGGLDVPVTDTETFKLKRVGK